MNRKQNSRILSGGRAVVESLKVEGVKHVFGLIGSSTMEIFDELYDNKSIKFIDVRDERTGSHMADGYARALQLPGIMIAGQNGPGATNLITGVAQASAAFSPLISIAGAVSAEHAGKDSFQEVDQQSLFEPITKKTWTINKIEEIPRIFNNAFSIAMKPRWGPVHINLPRNILSKEKAFGKFIKSKIKPPRKVSKDELLKTINLISSSSKPVIIAGAGIKNTNSHNEVIRLSKITNIPIVASAGHGDVIPCNEEYFAGQMGPRGNYVASRLVKEADLILAIGTRLGFNSTFFSYENINKEASIVQVDVEPVSLGRYFPVSIAIHSDAKAFVEELIKKISIKKEINRMEKWTENFIEERKNYLKRRDSEALLNNFPIQPSGLFKNLRKVLPKNSAITLDAGTLCLQATDALNYFEPPCLYTPLDFGLVGFSFACGLGVKVAKPKKPVVSLMGDGGFGMTISELSTAVHHKINTVTVVMNNKSWGAEKAYQRDFFKKRYIGSDITSPPFEKVAELYGAKGFKVERLSEINEAVQAALNCNAPAVVNVSVDQDALFSFRRDSFKHKS
ncbi:MAG: Sulfoacetaldehyde acetyltransferase [Alphaproteobacteria bacterium MarineAlpha5_Bin11]|nr:sulfoacetaldehyde acetyltransferase [Pelagibacteraceae bacterium]PPR44194.1 MAG: Sulfoacetaldehyde acetyltransferase [Alphaproteobacteria bacterium MarineAlpha5_Bin11]PPR51507.1 MAG: Sulfoacetaldehyde acetyltransferase [Alphaproteobacteria bacterium MarineAlpha5_Bin10]|tara:strand:+ start:5783 stop:7477 length:1695 start_codon:yes stop_codon:yes gene_type:complete